MDLQSWCHVSTKFLVCSSLLLLFIKSAQGNGICFKTEYVPRTRKVLKTYLETYRSNNWRCRQFLISCRLTRTIKNMKIESYNEAKTVKVCCPGYMEGTQASLLACKPVCDPPCMNSKCVAPDQCECNQGYAKRSGTENICEPVCTEQCENGYCSEPEVCSCYVGYRLHASHQYLCEPVCSQPCENGNCSAPDVCSCHAGYRLHPTYQNKCEPVCKTPCINSECVAPDQCECNQGYIKRSGSESICEPVCSEPCENGECSAPEICSCHAGYQLHPTHQYVCEPICTTPCINAHCSSPDVCTCRLGYTKTSEDSQQCQAHCSMPCQNALCTEPEVCTCLDGYKQENITNICLPVCDNECKNGICTGPNFCTCFYGFTLADNYYSCEPVCPNECDNAFCTAPGQCTCFPGYEMDVEDKSLCTPVCSQECVNSNCTAPNVCECYLGFEQTDDLSVCKPFCSEGCKNAICTQPEVCTCLWGYEKVGNSSGCTIESEKHECSFVNDLREYSYDDACFYVSGELRTEKLIDCKVLQELLNKQNEDSYGKEHISLRCDSASLFTLNDNSLELKIVCNVVLEEHSSTSKTTDTTTEQTDREIFYSTGIYASDFSSGIYKSEELFSPTFSEDTFQTSVDPITKNKIETETEERHDEKSIQNKFNIVFHRSTGDVSTVNSLNIPLNLNTTLQFLPMISRREITQSFFNQNNTNLQQEWCICHKERSWKLCTNETTQMYFCPCSAKDFVAQVTGDSTLLREAKKIVAFSAIIALLVR